MEFFPTQTRIDFLKIRGFTTALSLMLALLSLTSLGVKGLHWGLDFTGGILLELQYPDSVALPALRNALTQAGVNDFVMQHAGSDKQVMLRLSAENAVLGSESTRQMHPVVKQVLDTLHNTEHSDFHLAKVDVIGAHVGKELAIQGFWAILVAVFLMGIYIAFRFEYRFACAAAIALAHDPLLILGVFSFAAIECDLTTLAAILAVIGYSLNDTIVVFDRVKENSLKSSRKTMAEIVNESINQTLSRTIMTSLATLWVVFALMIWGGNSLWGFSLALCIGILVGTYSSIYVAGVLAVALGLKRENLMRHLRHNKKKRVGDGAVV